MAGFQDAMQGGQVPGAMDGFGEGQDQATEEEQALLDGFMEQVADALYPREGEVNQAVLDGLRGDFDPQALSLFQQAEPPLDPGEPKDALAATAVLLLVTIDSRLGYQQRANAEGEDADPSYTAVLWEAGQQLVELLADLTQAAGVADLDEEAMSYVWLRATDLYHRASPDLDREAAARALEVLDAAGREGRLNKVLPGLPGGAALPAQQPAQQPAMQEV